MVGRAPPGLRGVGQRAGSGRRGGFVGRDQSTALCVRQGAQDGPVGGWGQERRLARAKSRRVGEGDESEGVGKRVLKTPGATARVAEIEEELRLAAGLTALREQAGFSQRELARRMGASQPRMAAIEQSRNVTIGVLEQYADAVGGKLEVTVVKGKSKIPLMAAHARCTPAAWRRTSKRKTATTAAGKPVRTGMRRRGSRSA